jgi:Fur family transcriptional regulator, stress-responsive regulator
MLWIVRYIRDVGVLTGCHRRYDLGMQPTADEVAERLRRHGLRATAPRVAVLRAVGELSGHPDTDTIAGHVRGMLGTVSIQAVYDSLHAMTHAGLLRRIEPAGSPARYETRVGDNHHHVVCRSCGAARDIDCVVGAAPCLSPDQTADFVIDEAEVTFWGLCPECQAAAKVA